MGGLVGKGGGGGGPQFPLTSSINTTTPAFSLSGTSTFRQGGSSTVNAELKRLGSLAQTEFDTRFPRILSDIDTLRATIQPGFSLLRSARQKAVDNARTRAVSTLTDNLARRRLQGSTFAESAIARTERDFAELDAEQQAQSFLEELDANQRIIGFESTNLAEGINRELNELKIASGFASTVAETGSQNAQFALELAAEEAEASGSLFGTILGIGASFLTGNPTFAAAGFGAGTVTPLSFGSNPFILR